MESLSLEYSTNTNFIAIYTLNILYIKYKYVLFILIIYNMAACRWNLTRYIAYHCANLEWFLFPIWCTPRAIWILYTTIVCLRVISIASYKHRVSSNVKSRTDLYQNANAVAKKTVSQVNGILNNYYKYHRIKSRTDLYLNAIANVVVNKMCAV